MMWVTRPVWRRWAQTKIVGDGNSMMFGTGLPSPAGQNVLAQAVASAPLSAASYANVSLGGQTARQMNGLDGGSAADVIAAFDETKLLNVLVLREGTNSMSSAGGAYSGVAAAQHLGDYCLSRKAERPWRIIVLATPPIARSEWTQGFQDDYNSRIDAFNDWWRQNFGAVGVDRFVDTRVPGAIFGPQNFPDYTNARFTAIGDVWEITDPIIRVHLNEAGYAIEAAAVRQALLSLRA